MGMSLIDVATAKNLVKQYSSKLAPINIQLANALNMVLAADVFSPIDLPSFDQSAMDGYAVMFDDLSSGNPLAVINESFAGITQQFSLQPGTAARIFTGAPVPAGADTVIMQEQAIRDKALVSFARDVEINRLQNIRKQGAEIKQGELALEAGTLLTAGAIGFLAGIGITEIQAYRFPKVAIIVTGKELVQPGHTLAYGQVYESNGISLQSALANIGIANTTLTWADDDPEILANAINRSLDADLLLITGGVSVGDYDFVVRCLGQCGVNNIFHKVKQRPGKPLYFGKKDDCVVFGLPGNPSSVLSCFYQYVLPSIQQMMNREQAFLQVSQASLKKAITKSTALTHFLKGYYDQDGVVELSAQESFRLSSYAVANCVIEVPAEVKMIPQNELVKIYRLN